MIAPDLVERLAVAAIDAGGAYRLYESERVIYLDVSLPSQIAAHTWRDRAMFLSASHGVDATAPIYHWRGRWCVDLTLGCVEGTERGAA